MNIRKIVIISMLCDVQNIPKEFDDIVLQINEGYFEITNPHAIIPFMKWCKQQCEYVAIDIETLRIDDDTIYLTLDAFE